MGLIEAMNTGVRGLAASQLALDITSQNISNANTEGYSRKRLTLESAYRADPQFGQMGFGVEITNVTRIRDFFIDQQINNQNSQWAYYNELNSTLTRVENIFGEPSDTALSTVLDKFWDAWGDLANNPDSIAARDVVKATTQVLVDTMHNISGEIRSLRDDKNDNITVTVNQINSYLKQIYELNREISLSETGSGKIANDSRDARDLAVKNLSELINVTTEDNGDGSISVLTNGNMLVSRSGYTPLETTTVSYTRPDGSSYSDLGVRYSTTKDPYIPWSGKLKGILESRDEVIPYYEDKLDEIANTLVEQVNTLHRQGYTLNGTAGIDFFAVNSHDEQTVRHTEQVKSYTFAYTSLGMPFIQNLGTPYIESGSMAVTDSLGNAYTEGVDYTIDYTSGTITLLPAGAFSAFAPGTEPNVVLAYNYEVQRGLQSVQQTYASNIELSAAIIQDVKNIAAAEGQTNRKYADVFTDTVGPGVWQYIHRAPGPDNTLGTADDTREQASLVQGTVKIKVGNTTLRENLDYIIDYSSGRFSLLNGTYAGANFQVEYSASVYGSDGRTDNKNAVAIAALRYKDLMATDVAGMPTASINMFYSAFIGEMGIHKNEATANTESRKFLLEQFEARQAEIAGVSLDEELANLVKYQHTYQASARVISTVDKMLDILMNL
ncbi:MAG: flagellar hook-associated protein FlgK [Candidatus Raymondbacteria bacterium RifOxyA12_full_50_37]|uniref:Flagellar hook-associated protein 1 n=1 Tax=Candidatus Raymondbacteria bacterium RIFOXYD12_FULL_49_13 TaxID=1817890 RepID=A0A1F7F5F8_UNCRA|nr:MAG: flagellar hook-associated protein FlgK [Candidatus Raymondbacteria bacterium RifOxyA12_full_50_37]OGJ89222.1 MAG: flagellar hook-associated protein FlgK [Candidatus Raymondbacteria bacterium RIFOXYA2_FULL_49_16]OGJ97388.1 MAG: flagellar hook-associated protein FlgK [Candidatus Raymondbacteria bacterium RIFOXYC2_FULL_50_21]OGK01787.1 MAG: flagellar hook-associated protein FlgK [Candidatus Raymondbacteria bacterium RifOxyC12_full_50_8]OGK01905.1 MAG: flagellar hook-associated protein FlgK